MHKLSVVHYSIEKTQIETLWHIKRAIKGQAEIYLGEKVLEKNSRKCSSSLDS